MDVGGAHPIHLASYETNPMTLFYSRRKLIYTTGPAAGLVDTIWVQNSTRPNRNPVEIGDLRRRQSGAHVILSLLETDMRFYLGEIYQGEFMDGLRLAMVVALADQGRCATLRFIDMAGALTVDWAELKNCNWRRVPEVGAQHENGTNSHT
jgi:hypothetical protein